MNPFPVFCFHRFSDENCVWCWWFSVWARDHHPGLWEMMLEKARGLPGSRWQRKAAFLSWFKENGRLIWKYTARVREAPLPAP